MFFHCASVLCFVHFFRVVFVLTLGIKNNRFQRLGAKDILFQMQTYNLGNISRLLLFLYILCVVLLYCTTQRSPDE